MSETAVEEVVSPDEFTPYEQQLADKINQAGQRSGSGLAEVALGVGAAFVLYRTYMRRRLREETREMLPTPDALQEIATRIMRVYTSKWVATVIPALTVGYAVGLREAGAMRPSEAWIADSANAYARALGDNVHSVSTQALVEGVRAQINRRVAARVAIDRTIDAFGVTPRSMKAIVNMYMAPPPEKMTTDREVPNRLQDRIDARIARAITERARTLGDTEAHLTKNTAKAMYWSFSSAMGSISPLAEKEWHTAEDERVCPSCGPMHKKRVRVNELFELPDKTKVVGPAVHPNCRCDIRLVQNEQAALDSYNTKDRFALAKSAWGVVHKARGDDAYDRDQNGRFSSTESRRARPAQARLRPVARQQFKEPEVDFADPRVSQLLGQVEQMLVTSRKTSSTDKVSATPRISAQQRISATPKVSAQDKISATPVETANVETHKITTGTISADQQAKVSRAKLKNEAAMTSMRKTSFREPPKATFVDASMSEQWQNTPDGRSIYAVFAPHQWQHEGDLIFVDTDVPFYTAGTKGMGIPTLQQGIQNYWNDWMPPTHTGEMGGESFEAWWDAESAYVEGVGPRISIIADDETELLITYEAAGAAMLSAIQGYSHSEAPNVLIEEVTHVDAEWDEDVTITGEYEENAFTLAKGMGLHQLISDEVPYVLEVNKLTVAHDGVWGGEISNPGQWRVTSWVDRGQSHTFLGRDPGTMSYHMFTGEPEDL